MPDSLFILLVGIFLPLFPMSMVFNAILDNIKHSGLRALLFIAWPLVGLFIVLNTNVNVLQALATAGGLNTFAKRSKIKIFRETNGKTLIFPFDYDDVTDGEHLEQNRQLQRGDVVVVP